VITDEQLVEESLAGSALAFTELVERYQERLLRYLLTRATNRADAEDAVQDTFISAYRYLHSFNPQWRFSTWIYRIAIRNAARQARGDVHDVASIACCIRSGECMADCEAAPESGCICSDVVEVCRGHVD
jgi:RNA polymerase sigma-70 factor (ECF subfamily)